LNLVLAIVTVMLGEEFYGVGYFLACLISSVLAYVLVTSTFHHLNFLTFIGNNPSIVPGSSGRARAWSDWR
jgi:uncharacterized membrane protein